MCKRYRTISPQTTAISSIRVCCFLDHLASFAFRLLFWEGSCEIALLCFCTHPLPFVKLLCYAPCLPQCLSTRIQKWRDKANGYLKALQKRSALAFLGLPPDAGCVHKSMSQRAHSSAGSWQRHQERKLGR
eukprot:1201513-Amphidinium_carterae.1